MDAAQLATRFCSIVATFCRAIAVRSAAKKSDPEASKILLLLWTRLRRAATRFCGLAAGAPAPKSRSKRVEQKPRKPSPDLPRRRGWILAPVPEAAASAGQLRAFLADPDVQTLVGSDPRYGRILRPLCRTLGLKLPDFLRRPAPPRKKRRKPKRARAKQPKWVASLIMRGPFHPPGHPPGFIPPRRTRAPPRSA